MLASVHKAGRHIFQGPTHHLGGWGIAAGDINSDGAADLLISIEEGHVTLLVNDTLAMRGPSKHPSPEEAYVAAIGCVTVRPGGPRGVLGAVVRITDPKGRPVGIGQIGTNIATGCRGPDELLFALPAAQTYTVHVRYADGLERSTTVTPKPQQRTLVTIPRDRPTDATQIRRDDRKEAPLPGAGSD
jgi:hypothetical protein